MAAKVRVEVEDLQHGLHVVPVATVAGSDDVEVRRDANVLVRAMTLARKLPARRPPRTCG